MLYDESFEITLTGDIRGLSQKFVDYCNNFAENDLSKKQTT